MRARIADTCQELTKHPDLLIEAIIAYSSPFVLQKSDVDEENSLTKLEHQRLKKNFIFGETQIWNNIICIIDIEFYK